MQDLSILEPSAIRRFIQENTVTQLVDNAKKAILEDDKDPLEIFQAFKLFKDAFAVMFEDKDDKQFKELVISSAAKHITHHHGEKNPAILNGYRMYYGSNVQTDYNDTILESLKLQIKERQTYLKGLNEPIIDEDTAEILAQPPTYRVTQTLICTKTKF